MQQIKARLDRSGLNPDLVHDCLSVAEAIDDLEPSKAQFLTISYFVKERHVRVDHHRLLTALNFLCAMDCPLLSAHGFLNSEDGPQVLEDEDFKRLLKSGVLVHPESGREIPDPMRHVHVFYSLLPLCTEATGKERK